MPKGPNAMYSPIPGRPLPRGAIVHLGVPPNDERSKHGAPDEAEPPIDLGDDHGEEGHEQYGLPGLFRIGPARKAVQKPSDRG